MFGRVFWPIYAILVYLGGIGCPWIFALWIIILWSWLQLIFGCLDMLLFFGGFNQFLWVWTIYYHIGWKKWGHKRWHGCVKSPFMEKPVLNIKIMWLMLLHEEDIIFSFGHISAIFNATTKVLRMKMFRKYQAAGWMRLYFWNISN